MYIYIYIERERDIDRSNSAKDFTKRWAGPAGKQMYPLPFGLRSLGCFRF